MQLGITTPNSVAKQAVPNMDLTAVCGTRRLMYALCCMCIPVHPFASTCTLNIQSVVPIDMLQAK